MMDGGGDADFMTSFARGLAVLRSFADIGGAVTIAQVSRATGLSRPAVGRCLYTLVRLGYAAQDGTRYTLRPKVLALGYAYVSSSSLAIRAQPVLDRLRDTLHESCSLGVAEEGEVYYVARSEASRIMSVALRVGSRLPLHCTSMGRVLMAGWSREEQERHVMATPMVAHTEKTIIDPAVLLRVLDDVAVKGFAVVEEELETGLVSIAVPVRQAGDVIAAINIGAQAGRVSAQMLVETFLPALQAAAAELSSLGPVPAHIRVRESLA